MQQAGRRVMGRAVLWRTDGGIEVVDTMGDTSPTKLVRPSEERFATVKLSNFTTLGTFYYIFNSICTTSAQHFSPSLAYQPYHLPYHLPYHVQPQVNPVVFNKNKEDARLSQRKVDDSNELDSMDSP